MSRSTKQGAHGKDIMIVMIVASASHKGEDPTKRYRPVLVTYGVSIKHVIHAPLASGTVGAVATGSKERRFTAPNKSTTGYKAWRNHQSFNDGSVKGFSDVLSLH